VTDLTVPEASRDDYVSFLRWMAKVEDKDTIISVVEKPWKYAAEYLRFRVEGCLDRMSATAGALGGLTAGEVAEELNEYEEAVREVLEGIVYETNGRRTGERYKWR
jgi:hypothetical protein